MSESMQGALAGVIDRCASASPEPEPSFFGRIPEEVQPRKDLRAGPKLLLTVLDWYQRQFGRIDATDPQLAERCGCSVNTISTWLRQLEIAGLIERVGRTFRRIIRLLFRFKSTSTTPGTGGNQLPQEPGESTPGTGGGHPRNEGNPPPKPGRTTKYQRDKRDKGPAAASSPTSGDTPPPAKTTDTPPTAARPPLVAARQAEAEAIAARDAEGLARWDALPEAERSAIEAEVRAADPVLASFPPMFRANCLATLASRTEAAPAPAPAPPAVAEPLPPVEVLPTDRELGSLKFLADASNPFMRLLARATLREAGRDDVYRGVPRESKPAGEPPRGLPAGS